MADAVSVGLDRFAVDVSGSEGFEERVEADDGERVIRPVPARAESGSIKRVACSSISHGISSPAMDIAGAH
ncbi:MAG: hypothetical protein ACRDLS_15665 [Solirubrobacteraceae bacterium]